MYINVHNFIFQICAISMNAAGLRCVEDTPGAGCAGDCDHFYNCVFVLFIDRIVTGELIFDVNGL